MFVLVAVLAFWALPARSDEAVALCIIPSTAAGKPASIAQVAGHYASVSESEWNLELWLNADGTAEVLWEGWEAGHNDERTKVRYPGSWSLSGPFVELRYRGRCETLEFDPVLSFAEFGSQGEAPGLKGRHSSVSENLFAGISLWSAERLRSIPEVE